MGPARESVGEFSGKSPLMSGTIVTGNSISFAVSSIPSQLPSIAVVGSLNMDIAIEVSHHPMPGETVLGGPYITVPGGKGGNQAVAAARARASTDLSVVMVGCVGSDDFGDELRRAIAADGIDDTSLVVTTGSSGIACITVDEDGENAIVVSPGANHCLSPDRIEPDIITSASVVLLQLEIPLETVQHVVEIAAQAGTPVLLNPAPARWLSDELMQLVTYVVVNESEAALLVDRPVSDIASLDGASQAARELARRGPDAAIVTLGAQGIAWATKTSEGSLTAHPVDVVDTTAAGDTFCGAMAVAIAEGKELDAAIAFANAAGAIAVTRAGAQPSVPRRSEIEHLLSRSSP